MKILVVADSHGSPAPLAIAKEKFNEFEKIVFLGDFFDHGDEDYETQKENFLDVMKLKNQNNGKVVVLLGNHDANYLLDEMYKWQEEHAGEIQKLILDEMENIDIFFKEGSWLFTHAGVSEIWFKRIINNETGALISREECNRAFQHMNRKFHSGDFSCIKFCGTDPSGDEVTQNPLWIRPDSLKFFPLPGWNQVVGHSAVADEERIYKTAGGTVLLFLDSEPMLRNVYAEINTEDDSFSISRAAVECTFAFAPDKKKRP